jgi:hypothetical protein
MVELKNNREHGYRILMDFGKIADTYYPHFIVEHFIVEQDDSAHSKVKFSKVKFSIDMRIIEGEVPVEITQEIISWAHNHYKELEESWLCLVDREISSKYNRRKNNLTAA